MNTTPTSFPAAACLPSSARQNPIRSAVSGASGAITSSTSARWAMTSGAAVLRRTPTCWCRWLRSPPAADRDHPHEVRWIVAMGRRPRHPRWTEALERLRLCGRHRPHPPRPADRSRKKERPWEVGKSFIIPRRARRSRRPDRPPRERQDHDLSTAPKPRRATSRTDWNVPEIILAARAGGACRRRHHHDGNAGRRLPATPATIECGVDGVTLGFDRQRNSAAGLKQKGPGFVRNPFCGRSSSLIGGRLRLRCHCDPGFDRALHQAVPLNIHPKRPNAAEVAHLR